jgi:hypothetical protein
MGEKFFNPEKGFYQSKEECDKEVLNECNKSRGADRFDSGNQGEETDEESVRRLVQERKGSLNEQK